MSRVNASNRLEVDTLVLVHGYLGGSTQWPDQLDSFSKSWDVLTPDLPGFGNNAMQQSPDSIGGFADHVFEFIDKNNRNQFALLGHSMGGMIVQEMVAKAPERIEKLILYGTGPIGMLPGRFEPIEESARRIVKEGVEATARRIASTWFMNFEKAKNYSRCAEIAAKPTKQAALAALEAMKNWSGEGNLANISCPTLVIWGDGDRAYPWSQPELLWKNIPDASLAVVPGCSHAIHLENPEIFNLLITEFLSREVLHR